jgi:hypothetical protein
MTEKTLLSETISKALNEPLETRVSSLISNRYSDGDIAVFLAKTGFIESEHEAKLAINASKESRRGFWFFVGMVALFLLWLLLH